MGGIYPSKSVYLGMPGSIVESQILENKFESHSWGVSVDSETSTKHISTEETL